MDTVWILAIAIIAVIALFVLTRNANDEPCTDGVCTIPMHTCDGNKCSV